MRHILTGFILFSYKITSVSAFSINLLKKTLHPQKPDFRNFSTGAMTAASDNVTSSMSHFRNKRNMLIRTYKSVVPDAKASVVLLHGNCSHFRAEFSAYNMKWYMEKHAIGTPEVEDVVRNELMAVYPNNAGGKTTTDETKFPDAFTLDGRSFYDISPRFVHKGSFIEKLNHLGFNVYGLDHQSNGMSEGLNGKRNYFTNLEDIVDDVIQFIGIVKRNKFDEAGEKYDKEAIGAESVIGKVYLAGISMGGNIALRVAQKTSIYKNGSQNFIDGLIALAPMTDLSSYTDGVGKKIQLSISKAISMAYPSCTLGLAADNVPKNFNTFFRKNDPHYFGDVQCYAVILSLFDATRTLRKGHNQYPSDLPTLVLHGKNDDICDVKGSRDLVNKYLTGLKDIQYIELDTSVHCLTSSLYVDHIMPQLTTWLQRVHDGACPGA